MNTGIKVELECSCGDKVEVQRSPGDAMAASALAAHKQRMLEFFDVTKHRGHTIMQRQIMTYDVEHADYYRTQVSPILADETSYSEFLRSAADAVEAAKPKKVEA